MSMMIEPDMCQSDLQRAQLGRPAVMSSVLLVLLLGTLGVLMLVFQPFASAGGGCGGG